MPSVPRNPLNFEGLGTPRGTKQRDSKEEFQEDGVEEKGRGTDMCALIELYLLVLNMEAQELMMLSHKPE
jgi:hypothetical protein